VLEGMRTKMGDVALKNLRLSTNGFRASNSLSVGCHSHLALGSRTRMDLLRINRRHYIHIGIRDAITLRLVAIL
jgi:hypothetical protein